jgi:hypothetical protein
MRTPRIGLVGLVAAAAVATASPASAEPSSVTARLTGSATLVASGAGMEIPVVYRCSADAPAGGIDLFVTERVRNGRTAQGYGSTFGIVCDGTERTFPLLIVAANGFAFGRGVAIVQGSLYACDANGLCTYVPLSQTVTVRRAHGSTRN